MIHAVYESARCHEKVILPLQTRLNPLDLMVESGHLAPQRPGRYDIRAFLLRGERLWADDPADRGRVGPTWTAGSHGPVWHPAWARRRQAGLALRDHPGVEFAGVYEPDLDRRGQLAQADGPYRGVHWFAHAAELFGRCARSSGRGLGGSQRREPRADRADRRGGQARLVRQAGGRGLAAMAAGSRAGAGKGLHIQMGYMFRYHEGFRRIAEWARSGLLGDVFAVRGPHVHLHPRGARGGRIGVHRGGIFFDLAGHMLDQIVWLLGRPVQGAPRSCATTSDVVPGFADNTLAVLEYPQALAFVDIAAMEPPPMARRFEVYGTPGSAILLEPFEPAQRIRLCLDSAREGYLQGEQFLPVTPQDRQTLYRLELDAFLATIAGRRPANRSPEHELLVQETLLRCTGAIPT